ncbi:MAG: PadR family transcriptional regulator [Patescibacteria group bacterium]
MLPKNIKGFFEFLLLTTIATEPMYSKEIIERFNQVGISITPGTLYPILNRLKKEKMLEASTQETDFGGVRKYYSITKIGNKRLENLNTQWNELSQQVHKLRRKPYLDR